MADVFKGRTKDLAKDTIKAGKSLIIETVFNDESFKDLADIARHSGYTTSITVLFLDSIQDSVERVAFRGMQQSGITISGSNIKINFNESFKNIASYFFYFDRSDFIYTGEEINQKVMTFQNGKLIDYYSNHLDYPQKFAHYSFHKERLSEEAYQIITANNDYMSDKG